MRRFTFILASIVIIGLFVLGLLLPVTRDRFPSRIQELSATDKGAKIDYKGIIPKRLHQTYKEEMIPHQYRSHIESWLANQPDWEFFFWTDEEAMSMIQERYPEYIQLLKSYDHGLMRSDAIRYFILHQYGGVYADLDMRSLRPLESLLQSEPCIMTPEPDIQTRLLFSLPWTLTNCIMACTANHPFLAHLLKGLQSAKKPFTTNTDVLYATGPFYLNSSLTEYMKQHPDCKGTSYCRVNITEGRYLVPVPDMIRLRKGRRECMSPSLTARYSDLQQDACRRLLNMNTENTTPLPDAYTDHRWTHVGWFPETKRKTVNIKDVVPNVLRYKTGNLKSIG